MTSVSVRFEEMMASHRFELQSETKDDHQQSRKLRKMMFLSQPLQEAEKGFILRHATILNNCGKIIQLQKETAYLNPPSYSLFRETIVKILLEIKVQVKKITLSLHSLHSLQSAWSTFQHDQKLKVKQPPFNSKLSFNLLRPTFTLRGIS